MRTLLQKWGKTIGIILFLFLAFFAGNFTSTTKPYQTKVLGVSTHSTPTPTLTPVPKVQPITIINNIILPTPIQSGQTQAATVTQTATPTPTPVVIVATSTPTPAVSPTQTPSPTPTATPTPTPVPQTIIVTVDYAGEHTESIYTITITSGETAWQAVQDAAGITNIQYTDYGGSLGIFITGFNGIDASSNQYFDFQVNGVSSNVGVSSYTVQNNDVLKFVLTSF